MIVTVINAMHSDPRDSFTPLHAGVEWLQPENMMFLFI